MRADALLRFAACNAGVPDGGDGATAIVTDPEPLTTAGNEIEPDADAVDGKLTVPPAVFTGAEVDADAGIGVGVVATIGAPGTVVDEHAAPLKTTANRNAV